jgi:hypothetical protein
MLVARSQDGDEDGHVQQWTCTSTEISCGSGRTRPCLTKISDRCPLSGFVVDALLRIQKFPNAAENASCPNILNRTRAVGLAGIARDASSQILERSLFVLVAAALVQA